MLLKAIVTFNPILENLEALIKSEKNDVIIVDNASSNQEILNKKLSNFDNVVIISLSENKGIAYAQNLAIKYAVEKRIKFILFFDQDSHIDQFFVDKLSLTFNEIFVKDPKIAAIGPRFKDETKGFFFPALKFNKFGLIDKISVENIKSPIEVSFLISSGTLVSMAALKDIGYMKEEFFIDYVDTEWCFRAISKGYKLFMSEKAIMEHSIGDDTIKLLNFKIPVHSGYRRYYRIRNLFFMWKMQYIPKILIVKLMITNFAIQILLIIFKSKKLDYIKYYFKAIKDGINQSRNYHG